MRLGIIGYGNIGRTLVDLLADRPVDALVLLVRSERVDQLRGALAECRAAASVKVVGTAEELIAAGPDLVVECAGHSVATAAVPALLEASIDVILVSIGVFADPATETRLRNAAEVGRAQLILPAGAIGGIDILASLAAGGGVKVSYRGIKPPAAWAGTPAETLLDLSALTNPAVFFKGSAREAAQTYPKNANVAATLALAGAGFDATLVELVADPGASGNIHSYSVESPLARYSMTIENAASAGNARTSVATVYSVLREINNRRSSVVI